MALNPKLNIFVVGLNPRDKEASPTYRDYFKSKYFGNANTSDDSAVSVPHVAL